jgi:hypothetical protein
VAALFRPDLAAGLAPLAELLRQQQLAQAAPPSSAVAAAVAAPADSVTPRKRAADEAPTPDSHKAASRPSDSDDAVRRPDKKVALEAVPVEALVSPHRASAPRRSPDAGSLPATPSAPASSATAAAAGTVVMTPTRVMPAEGDSDGAAGGDVVVAFSGMEGSDRDRLTKMVQSLGARVQGKYASVRKETDIVISRATMQRGLQCHTSGVRRDQANVQAACCTARRLYVGGGFVCLFCCFLVFPFRPDCSDGAFCVQRG